MKKAVLFLSVCMTFISCRKESDNIVWSKSFGQGNAWFVNAASDSGILACGRINDKAFLVKLSEDKTILADYSSDLSGIYTSAWGDTSCFIAAGASEGKMLLSGISPEGIPVWDTTLASSFKIEVTSMISTGNGSFLALGSANPDSSDVGATGLLFVRFSKSGTIILKKEIPDDFFIAASSFTTDNSGNIYLALTRRNPFARSRAAVAKYNSDIQKLWETELYNNPDVTSTCIDLALGMPDSVYVTGKTEVSRKDGTLDNSYLVSLGKSGTIGKKKYLENSNSGSGIVFDGSGRIMLLNKNCFFISIIDPVTGYIAERLRMFSQCDAYRTDAFGSDIDINYKGDLAVAGSQGDNFYLALKSFD